MTAFKKRVYGCAIVKATNANYNADFSHQPRTLPNGVVYATDKAKKYPVRNFLLKELQEKVFYFKSFKEDTLQPRDLNERYEQLFGVFPTAKGKDKDAVIKKAVASNLLSCIDVRLFGGTFAGKTNLSLHGPVQITHGENRYALENTIYSEQIMSPFRNSSEKGADSDASTLGTQARLQEGHYVHNISVNPKNLDELNALLGDQGTALSEQDIEKLKEALRVGVTYYDSSSKAGVENELLLWVELKEGSRQVMPSFVKWIAVSEDGVIDLSKVSAYLAQEHIKAQVEKVELFYNEFVTQVEGAPKGAVVSPLDAVSASV